MIETTGKTATLRLGDIAPDFVALSTEVRFAFTSGWARAGECCSRTRRVATLYGMIHPNASETATVRSVFVIGPDKRVKLTLTYPASTGRNFDELLRVVDSLQLTATCKVATPADWRNGQDVIVLPSVSDDEADRLFPNGYRTLKPYLRVTPQPNR